MKKTFAIAILFLLGTALHAGPVTPERALQVAARVFSSASATKSVDASSLKIVWDGEFEPATKAAQDPALYVITRPEGGFVMVAGDDNVQPVLGFSFENDFKVEGMPENVRWWMEQYKDYVRSARLGETKATATPVEDGTEGLTDEFLSSRTNLWSQANPANYYCPDVEGQPKTSACGCGPLATAIIMAWFGTRNPASVSGTVPGYRYTSHNGKTVEIPAHELGKWEEGDYEYMWAELKNLTGAQEFYHQAINPTEENKHLGYKRAGAPELTPLGHSLAHLVYDIGTLLQAEYNDTGTGALTWDVPRFVGPAMGYNNQARWVKKEYYTNAQWRQMIKDEIDQHPVFYAGAKEQSAHAYVADGYATYDGNLLFHFNMGWGGSSNGYYTLDIQGSYDRKHEAVLDFYPAPSSSAPLPRITFDAGSSGMEYVSGYNTGELQFVICWFYNVGPKEFRGQFYVKHTDAGGNLVDYININDEDPDIDIVLPMIPPHAKGKNNFGMGPVRVSPANVAFGDRLLPYFKETGKDNYVPFFYQPFDIAMPALSFFPAAAISKAESYHVGDFFEFAIINNSYPHRHSKWKVTAPDGSTSDYVLDDYRIQFTSPGEYKMEATVYDSTDASVERETLVTYITVE